MSDDIVAELDRWLTVFPAEEVPDTIGRSMVQRARDEIMRLRTQFSALGGQNDQSSPITQ